jgi:HupE / UreJ protein
MRCALTGLALLLALLSAPALAHKPSDSRLSLGASDAHGRIEGRWDIALRDLEEAVGLDADDDGVITWGELRRRHADIAAYALARLRIEADGRPCTLQAGEQLVDEHSDGTYTVLPLQIACAAAPKALRIGYSLLADIDAQHRGLLTLHTGGGTRSALLQPQAEAQRFELAQPGRLQQFGAYLAEGVWHIWIGFDHILFLLSLLLPAVLAWVPPRWLPVNRFAPACWDVVRVVTAFTVAHSITLSLATLQWLSLPSRAVESAIAASVLLAALNNLRPLVLGRRWLVAFGFGLIHGFGFASVLAELGLPDDSLLLALLGFNLGVEAGQLAIVLVFLPLAFALRNTWLYQRVVFTGGSLAIALLSAAWFAERALNLELLPF